MTSAVTFASLGLATPLLDAVADAGYTIPTPIQAQAIPLVLAGRDLFGAAQTGTGKTAGFTLPILHMLHARPGARRPGRPRCLILAPTRELAAQIEESVRTYGRHLPLRSLVVYGGVGIGPQIAGLKQPLDILVATPGRLLDHAGQRTVDLGGVEILVLDEADRMLDMGFIRDIRRVLKLLPVRRQNLLFSATFSDEVRELAGGFLHDPGTVEVARRNTPAELVAQSVYFIPQKQKRHLLAHLIQKGNWQQVLVFTRTKHGANRLAEQLVKGGLEASAIHGNKSQGARSRALAGFKSGSVAVLVATDIAARGLDIDELPHVVNFEIPNVPEDYIHRIGRTGRAGLSGTAISLVDPEEMTYFGDIEKLIGRRIERLTADDFVASTVDDGPSRPAMPPQSRRRDGRQERRPGAPASASKHPHARPAAPAPKSAGHAGARSGAPKGGNSHAPRGSAPRSPGPIASRAAAPADPNGGRGNPPRAVDPAGGRAISPATPRPDGGRGNGNRADERRPVPALFAPRNPRGN